MVETTGAWTMFHSRDELFDYLKGHSLMSENAEVPKPLQYTGAYTCEPVPCQAVGYVSDNCVVIEIDGKLHCIDPTYLAEMQSPAEKIEREKGKSVTRPVDSFTVLDIETTGFNPSVDQIIEISAIKYRNGKEVGCFSHLVCPDQIISKRISALTGISPAMVANQPKIGEIIPKFLDFVDDDIIVGHNVSFDINFIYDNALRLEGRVFRNDYIDTCRIARKALPDLRNHKLSTLVDYFKIDELPTHRAEDDCRATAALYFRLRELNPKKSDSKPNAKRSDSNLKITDIQPSIEVDPTSPIYGKSFVFTGELSIAREVAWQTVVDMGGVLKSSVSGKTDYLIVGEQDLSIVGTDGRSTKERRAAELNSSGKGSITILDEEEFFKLLGKEVVSV